MWLPGASIPATPFAGLVQEHSSVSFVDSVSPSLRGRHLSITASISWSLRCGFFRNLYLEGPRQLASRPFKLPGQTSFTPPIISDWRV
ncbi:hypothetical protein TNCV_2426971 [Trichonephila clavipes]|nr:hypothetical protein TNCV_2426971 [Trichonephila clavipes]